ncbi:MAG TPA: hypothetical protein VKB79_14740 [Bryobacteraceae bacterium]|nr:hypothetical protein [Bryobacteraceae bacterium]
MNATSGDPNRAYVPVAQSPDIPHGKLAEEAAIRTAELAHALVPTSYAAVVTSMPSTIIR